jgi:chromosome segregation ATPase
MTDQVTDTPTLIPCAPKEKSTGSEADVMDQAANAILGLVDRAADTAVADVQEAREFAEKLADELRAARDQLRVAQDRINNLEAKVGYYQDRTERAEKWLTLPRLSRSYLRRKRRSGSRQNLRPKSIAELDGFFLCARVPTARRGPLSVAGI